MNYSNRIWLYGPVALFAILMIGIMGYWFSASHAVSARLDALNGHEIAPGIKLSFAQKTMSGFPFRIDGELDGLRIEIATSHGPTVWSAEKFAFHSLTYGRTQFVFESAGKQDFAWHDDRGAAHDYNFLPGALRASVIASHGEVSRFDLDLLDADSTDVAAAHVQLHLRKDPTIDGLDLVISADDVRIAQDLAPAFGSNVKSFHLDALISPGTSFDGLLAGRTDWRVAVEDWRKRQGGVRVNTLDMRWNQLSLNGHGAMTVDDAHRPYGELKLSVTGWQSWLAGAKQLHVSGPDNGLAPAFQLGAEKTHSDAPLATTLAFKDGVAFVGDVPADTTSPLY